MKTFSTDMPLILKSGTLSLGDWGTESLKCFFGGLTSVPMLALPKIPLLTNNKTNTKIQTNQEKNMHHLNYKSDHGVSHKPLYLKLILIHSIFVFITGCSFQVHKRDLIQNVLTQQNALIEKLETERHDSKIVSKIKRDESLWEAELHLKEAIKALKNANEVIKETF